MIDSERLPIYLDHNATTPVAPEVADAMGPWLREKFGNPSSSHVYGRAAREAMAQARHSVARLIGAKADELVFTGSATEANNLALLGNARRTALNRRHLVVSAVEHPAVAAPAEYLRAEGWDVTVLCVDRFGCVDIEAHRRALRPTTALVSIMHANNEVGTIQPIAELAALAHANGSLVHSDAAQSAGKIAVDVVALGVDLLTLAGHKFYGPKGIGALYVRTGVRIENILFGADQEHGLRPGTENVPHIVGLGVAADLARTRLDKDEPYLRALRDLLQRRLADAIPGLMRNGHPESALPNTLHVSFPGVSGRSLLAEVADTVAASVGSACHSETDAVSGVLAAMGCDAGQARGAVRFSVGRSTSAEEVEFAADALIAGFRRLSIS